LIIWKWLFKKYWCGTNNTLARDNRNTNRNRRTPDLHYADSKHLY